MKMPPAVDRFAMTIFLGSALAVVPARKAPAQSNDFIFPTSPLAEARGFHGTATMGEYLYVFGGTVDADGASGPGPEKPTNNVEKARILSDGSLGPWEPTTPLPQTRHYTGNSTLVLNDVVYIIGGSESPLTSVHYNTAIYSRPLPNGTLLPWSESKPFGEHGLTTITAISTPGHIHIIGGSSGNGVVPDVWTNPIYADGSMGDWQAGPPLPVPLWYQSAGVAAGRVYVWGGLKSYEYTSTSPQVLSAPILGSGKLGAWRAESVQLPKAFYGASSAVAGPYLISFSPRYSGAEKSNDLWFAQVTPSGISQWQARRTQISNRVYHAACPDYRQGLIYLGGGRPNAGKGLLEDSIVFRLTPQAQRMAEQGWMASQLAHANTVAALPPPAQQAGRKITLSYQADEKLRANAVGGFRSLDDARHAAAAEGKPLAVYFNLEDAAPCIQQNAQLAAPEFLAVLGSASFAWVDSRDYPQIVQQLGVYRVPTWIFYDKAGNEITQARRVGVMPAGDIARTIAALR